MNKVATKILLTVAVTGAGLIVRKGINRSWEKSTKRPVPNSKALTKDDWKEAVIWTAVTGAVVGLARLGAQESLRQIVDDTPLEDMDEIAEDVEV